MKKFLAFGVAAMLVLAASCTGDAPGLKTEKYAGEPSADHASLGLYVELPKATTEGAAVMRQTLVDVMDKALSNIDDYGAKRFYPRFEGDINDSKALFSYYEQHTLEELAALSEAVCELGEERTDWGLEFKIEKTWETDRIAVFDSRSVVYAGGAHGGVIGAGPMTFDKQSGMRIRDFFAPGAEKEMQSLLRDGMLEYFKESIAAVGSELDDYLDLKDGLIPLPKWDPRPCADGLVFTYQHYEVASYGDGMPEFILAYEDVAPYLLPEAKTDLGL